MKYLAYCLLKMGKVKWVAVFCGTAKDWDFLDPKWIITDDFDNKLQQLHDWSEENPSPGCVIFDDITGVVRFKKEIYDKVVTRFRHFSRELGWTLLVGIHYANRLTTTMKEAASQCVIFEQTSKNSINSLYENYGQLCFSTYNEFRDYLKKFAIKRQYQFILFTKEGPKNWPMFQPAVIPYPLPEFRASARQDEESDP